MRRPTRSRVNAAARSLDRAPLLLGTIVLVCVAFLSYVSIIAINGVPFQQRYPFSAIVPADAPLLKDGDEVRVAGRRAGQVRSVEDHPDGALVGMELTDGGIGEGASATVRLRGLAGLTYVQIDRGDESRPLLPNATIPRSRTSSGVELTDVVDVFDPETRDGLDRSLSGYGRGLTGRGDDLNAAVEALAPALTDGEPLIDAFTPGRGEFAGLLAQARRTVRAAAPPGSRDLAEILPPGAVTFGALANRSEELATAIARLRGFEDAAIASLSKADPLLGDLEATADALEPGIRQLARSTPDLNNLLAKDERLADVVRLARAAQPTADQAEPLLRDLRPAATALEPFARPLRPLAAALIPYDREIIGAPSGFGEWGRFFYPGTGEAEDGLAHRAVRFGVVLTCHFGRETTPDPRAARKQREPC